MNKNQPVANFIPSNNLCFRSFITGKASLGGKFCKIIERGWCLHLHELPLKHFSINCLEGAMKKKTILGDLLAVILNNSMYTPQSRRASGRCWKSCAWKSLWIDGMGKRSAGTIAPGGSMTNFMAMLMAGTRKRFRLEKPGCSGKWQFTLRPNPITAFQKCCIFLESGDHRYGIYPCRWTGDEWFQSNWKTGS